MILVVLAACGGTWNPRPFEEIHAGFPLDCAHAEAPCESCHDPSAPPAKLEDDACIACHEPDRPASHDPVETAACEACHGTCGWDAASPHPEGFEAPDLHGLAFKLQDPSEGDCRDCHGERLDGGEAQSCDGCHAESGIPDWRTDCVLCHGGESEPSGAPPADIDDQAPISFEAHTAHVDGGDYRPTPCSDCHIEPRDVLGAAHVFDLTPEVAEVDFGGGPSGTATWTGSTCANLYCHGSGQGDDGMVAASGSPMDCESCHPTAFGWGTMSAEHDRHLDAGSIVCGDCHAAVIDPGGQITAAERHVDGVRDVTLLEPAITTTDGGRTCTGSCHGVDHGNDSW